MTKADVFNQIRNQTGLDQEHVKEVVETFFIVIKDSLTRNEPVTIRGFGTFHNKHRKRKLARNISTNTALIVDEHHTPAFKPSNEFSNAVRYAQS